MKLLMENNKFIGSEWDLLYRKSTHQRFDDEEFIREQYENKKNVLCIIESDNNYVLGGYSSTGWISGNSAEVYNRDDKAYVFGLRFNNNGNEPIISNIKPEQVDVAIRSQGWYYLLFGTCAVIHMNKNGGLHHLNPECYEKLPTNHHLLGGSAYQTVKDVEIFQLK